MNMPFELGLDMGFRRFAQGGATQKKFIIFQKERFDLDKSLSDLSGADVEFHEDDIEILFKKLRDFLKVEVGCRLPGAAKLEHDYLTFQGWLTSKKINEGHSVKDAHHLPARELIDEASVWMAKG